MGREKGFEMWEELGFYEGFAIMWKAIVESQAVQDECAYSQLAALCGEVYHHIRRGLEAHDMLPLPDP